MQFSPKFDINVTDQYGQTHCGAFARILIKKDERIYQCDENICDYLMPDKFHDARTSDQVLEIFEKHPDKKDFIRRFMYMIDDDMYDWPRNFMEEKHKEACCFFNHRYFLRSNLYTIMLYI